MIFVIGVILAIISFFNLLPSKPIPVSSSIVQQAGFKDSATALVKMVDSADKALNHQLKYFYNELQNYYPDNYHIDTNEHIMVNGVSTPKLMNGDKLINLNETIPDHFLKTTGVISTIFVRSGNDFIRISTSLKDENDVRAIGTYLSHTSPAYLKVLNGESYIGPSVIFGQSYMTKYRPIKDAQGEVIAVLFLGIDIVAQLN